MTKPLQFNRMFCAMFLLFTLLQWPLISAAALAPFDSVAQNVRLNAHMTKRALASSQTAFNPTQSAFVKLKSLWVNCGISNLGPAATFRVIIDLASNSIEVYFEFVHVFQGWNGVAHGNGNYDNRSFDDHLSPSGAASTGISVHLGDNVINSGAGFNSVVRVWADSINVDLYVGECQYGINWTPVNNSPPSMNPTLPMNPITLIALSSVIAFPILTVSILAVRIRRPTNYRPRQGTTSWGSIAAITGGGMLLAASLWQLKIVEISTRTPECSYYWPFGLGGPTCWWVARNFWFAGVFAAFVLTLIGSATYAGFTRSLSKAQLKSYRATSTQDGPALSAADEKLYNYITQHNGTISLSTTSNDLDMSIEEINASINRLKQARRIEQPFCD